MTIPYRINQIKTKQFAFFPESYDNDKKISCEASFTFGYPKTLDHIKCIAQFKYLQDETLILISETECIFDISPEGTQELEEMKKIPVDFLRYMASIVTGTVRGIIHAKTEGTILNTIVLPPINLVELIKEDLAIGL